MEGIVTKFNLTGPVEISIDAVVEQWDNCCLVTQWHDQFRLVRFDPDTKEPVTKLTITKEAMRHLIMRLALVRKQDGFFKNAATWRPFE